MAESLAEFKAHTARTQRLSEVASLVGWDQQTYMPPGAAASRAEQSAVLAQHLHEMSTSEEAGRILCRAEVEVAGMDPDSDEARMVQVARRAFDRAIKLPVSYVAERSRHQALAMSVWQQARRESNFAAFAPALEKAVELARQYAEFQGYSEHPYDALLEPYEPGATQAKISAMFADLTPHLVKLAAAIKERPLSSDSALHGDFPIPVQCEFTASIVKSLGFDFARGRQDEAVHPFCTSFSSDDVRITTRYDSSFLAGALYASIHEAGHALYEQGIPRSYSGTPLAQAASLGIHESQSRLWENIVGRSRAFSQFAMPQLRAAFPSMGAVSVDEFYLAVNRVEPSYIRVEADEVTYNLHIALRFEIECDLITGKLAVGDLPAAWNSKMQHYLGISPPDDARGVLQDVHWAIGLMGYFPTYSIGNLVSAQLWRSFKIAMPDAEELISRGQFGALLSWLRENVHSLGRKFYPDDVVTKSTGAALSASHFTNYLTTKFGDIYGL